MPYDIADLKNIKIEIKNYSSMATPTDNVDYSYSNEEKLIIHNSHPENEQNCPVPSLDLINSVNEALLTDKQNMDVSNNPGPSKPAINVDEAISKIENILDELKKQRDKSPENRRIVRNISNKRSRRNSKRRTSTPRYDYSSDRSSSLSIERSPSPKRTRREPIRKKMNMDSTKNRFREDSLSSLSSDRSYSCVSKILKKELSNFLGNSFMSSNSRKHRYSRKDKRERSRSKSADRSRFSRRSRKDYSRDRSRSRRGESYDRYSRKKATHKHSDRYNNYNRNYQQGSANDIEERYSRYYAVMYAFSIIMDILRQDDIYSTF